MEMMEKDQIPEPVEQPKSIIDSRDNNELGAGKMFAILK
jgi:hypothetical protein